MKETLFFINQAKSLLQCGTTVRQYRPHPGELPALERLEKSPLSYNGRNVVATLTPSFLIESSPFLQVRRTCIKDLTILNFRQIYLLTIEFAALERLKINISIFSRLLLIRSFSNLQITRKCIIQI